MGDFKSKLPDFKEIGSIASKLFKDVKTSVGEIIQDYKKKHAERQATAAAQAKTKQSKPAATSEETITPKVKKSSSVTKKSAKKE
jgi:ppGpp synthetase/RelA/SpoT-type nucleotidyltranferase